MKNCCVLVIVIGILIVDPIFAKATDLQFQPPVLKVYEVDESNNVVGLYDRIDEQRSEAIIDKLDHLRLECHAYYPVQWIYTGNGVRKIILRIIKSFDEIRNHFVLIDSCTEFEHFIVNDSEKY